MSDFDDITVDYETEPRLSDIDLPDGWPSDAAIRGFIRATNRWGADTPVSDALVAAFRQSIIRRAYLMWHARKVRRRLKPLIGWTKRERQALAVFWDLLNEPWVRVGLTVMTGYTALVLWSARELLLFPRLLRDSPRHMGSGLLCYTVTKLDLTTEPPRPSWNPWEPCPWHIAAVNAVSADAGCQVYDRLQTAADSSRHKQIDVLFDRLEALGRAAVAEHGAWLCEHDPGPPRGLIPYTSAEIERAEAARKKAEREATATEAEAATPMETSTADEVLGPIVKKK